MYDLIKLMEKKSFIAKCKPFFRYFIELKKAAPVIAYYSGLYGINQSLEILKHLTPEQKKEYDQ